MSQALALMPFGELTEQDIITVRETIAKDCNDSQFRLFMGIAKASGANPVLQEIHPSVFQGKLTVQFGIDFHVRKAKETEGYQGYDVQLVHDNDDFKMHQEKAEDGRYYAVIDEHSWGFPRGKVVGGYAIAYKEGYAPFTVVMDVEEVEHFKRSQIGMQKTMWTNYFNDMFKKHMTRRALKAAFGLRFDDVEPADSGPATYEAPQRKDITADVEVTESKKQPPPEDNEATKMKKARAEMKQKFNQLGITDQEAMGEYIAQHCKTKGDKPTLAEITGLLIIMDMHISEKQEQAADNDELT
ncbi:RecT family recombinase [Brevibacillus reuszeri]|uniref:RecT family recombinase n=1 Tax=Brevibacillus reuszeri TaxID=54915 RepID=UPI0028A2B7EC|nr:RecT family recombinase [Brevibacillus reuszeri]